MMGSGGNGVGQEFCLKWNNHTTTILSVMDSLLEEESLVDVTLSADGQFVRAHRVILSACSPYFRQTFKSSFLLDKHPVIIMKDVDFDILKCLVEYMYKGEANVPQQMLPAFIQTAESLQIRGLCDGASKQKLAELNSLGPGLGPPHLQIPSIPITPQVPLPGSGHFKAEGKGHKGAQQDQSILAARLAQFVDPMKMEFQEQLARAARSIVPPPMKKPRKNPSTSTPHKAEMNGLSVKKDLHGKNVRLSPKTSNIMTPASVNSIVSALTNNTNNNDESDSDVLKIDEDGDVINKDKEGNDKDGSDDDIAAVNENGMDDSEEEIAMGNNEIAERTGNVSVGFINPWTGEEIPSSISMSDHDEDSIHGEGPFFPSLMDQSGLARSDLVEEKPPASGAGGDSGPRDPATNKYSCGRCGRSYLHQATLVRHQRYECGITASYPCQLCGRKFKRRDVLKGHMEKCMSKSAASSPANSANNSLVSMPSIAGITSLASAMASAAAMPSMPHGPC